MAKHEVEARTTKEIMKEYVRLAGLSSFYGRSTYKMGTCPKCNGKMIRMGQKVDHEKGVYEAGYEKCEDCGERQER